MEREREGKRCVGGMICAWLVCIQKAETGILASKIKIGILDCTCGMI